MGWKCNNDKCPVVLVDDASYQCPQCAQPKPKGKGKGRGPTNSSKGKGKGKGKAAPLTKPKSRGKGNTQWGKPYWGQKGATGRQQRAGPTTSEPSARKESVQVQKLRARIKALEDERAIKKTAAPKMVPAHEIYTSFEGKEMSLYDLCRTLEVEESTRGYKGHPRYAEILAAIRICRNKRDAYLEPETKATKMEKILAKLQEQREQQRARYEQLEEEQRKLDRKWEGCNAEIRKLEDQIQDATEDLRKAEIAKTKRKSTPAHDGRGESSNAGSGREHQARASAADDEDSEMDEDDN